MSLRLFGAPGYVTGVDGTAGGALSLVNAAGQSTEFASPNVSNPNAPWPFPHGPGQNWYCEMWVNNQDVSTFNQARAIIGETNALITGNVTCFFIDMPGSTVGALRLSATGMADVNNNGGVSIANALQGGSGWRHLFLALFAGAPTSTMCLYVDGTLRVKMTGNYTFTSTGVYAYLGNEATAGRGWNGYCDELLFGNAPGIYGAAATNTVGSVCFTVASSGPPPSRSEFPTRATNLLGYHLDGTSNDVGIPTMLASPSTIPDSSGALAIIFTGINTPAWVSQTNVITLASGPGSIAYQNPLGNNQVSIGYIPGSQSSPQTAQFADSVYGLSITSAMQIYISTQPSFTVSPNVVTVNTTTAITITPNAHASYNSSTGFFSQGGVGASVTGTYPNLMLIAGSQVGQLTIYNNVDSATYIVQVVAVSVAISPAAAVLSPGQILLGPDGNTLDAFVAQVFNETAQGVNWAVSSGGGTIVSNGFNADTPPHPRAGYTAPPGAVTMPTTYTITATTLDGVAFGTAAVTIVPPPPPAPAVINVTTSGATDTITIPVAPAIQPGGYPLGTIKILAGTAAGNESVVVATWNAPFTFPLVATHPTPTPGLMGSYVAIASDNQTPANSSTSNEVITITSSLGYAPVAINYPGTVTVAAPYGLVGAGKTIGVTVYDAAWGVLVPHTTVPIHELPGTGLFGGDIAVDRTWNGYILVDAPPGVATPMQYAFGQLQQLDNTGRVTVAPTGLDAIAPEEPISNADARSNIIKLLYAIAIANNIVGTKTNTGNPAAGTQVLDTEHGHAVSTSPWTNNAGVVTEGPPS